MPFTSILSIDPRGLIDLDLLHVEYGFAKDFASGGMKLGALVTQSEPILMAVDSLMRFHGAAGPVVNMACTMLEDRDWCRAYIERMRGKIATAHRHVTEQLRNAGIRYLPGSNAGFFVWVDLSDHLPRDCDGEVNAEFALAKLLVRGRVFLHPQEEHGNKPGWFRLVYTQDADIVTEGIQRYAVIIEVHEKNMHVLMMRFVGLRIPSLRCKFAPGQRCRGFFCAKSMSEGSGDERCFGVPRCNNAVL